MKALGKFTKSYKYITQEWVQPILSANGTLGGNSFAVQANSNYSSFYAYKAFDGNTGTSWQSNGTSASATYLIFYNPNPLTVTKITWNGTPTYGTITAGIVYGSNSNGNWTQLATFSGGSTSGGTMDLSSNTEYYSYYKITPTSWTDSGGTWTNGWAELKITATERVGEKEVEENGDFTKDFYLLYKESNKYYAVGG